MKKIRCPYFELNDLARAYHDKEWRTPCRVRENTERKDIKQRISL